MFCNVVKNISRVFVMQHLSAFDPQNCITPIFSFKFYLFSKKKNDFKVNMLLAGKVCHNANGDWRSLSAGCSMITTSLPLPFRNWTNLSSQKTKRLNRNILLDILTAQSVNEGHKTIIQLHSSLLTSKPFIPCPCYLCIRL